MYRFRLRREEFTGDIIIMVESEDGRQKEDRVDFYALYELGICNGWLFRIVIEDIIERKVIRLALEMEAEKGSFKTVKEIDKEIEWWGDFAK